MINQQQLWPTSINFYIPFQACEMCQHIKTKHNSGKVPPKEDESIMWYEFYVDIIEPKKTYIKGGNNMQLKMLL